MLSSSHSKEQLAAVGRNFCLRKEPFASIKKLGIAAIMIGAPLLLSATILVLAPIGVLFEFFFLMIFNSHQGLCIGLAVFLCLYAVVYGVSMKAYSAKKGKSSLSGWVITGINCCFLLALAGFVVATFD